jgi:hypothetical protein
MALTGYNTNNKSTIPRSGRSHRAGSLLARVRGLVEVKVEAVEEVHRESEASDIASTARPTNSSSNFTSNMRCICNRIHMPISSRHLSNVHRRMSYVGRWDTPFRNRLRWEVVCDMGIRSPRQGTRSRRSTTRAILRGAREIGGPITILEVGWRHTSHVWEDLDLMSPVRSSSFLSS